MHMLYNSDNYVVVLFEDALEPAPADEGASERGIVAAGHGGYEIVDKLAKKEIYISGSLAQSFKVGVDALIQSSPSEEEMDAYIERFAPLMQQTLVLH